MSYDYDGKGISIVRCGGKNELDRFYRLYSEFGIPCFILFDGDSQNAQTEDRNHTIKANRDILSLFGCTDDFPDGNVHESYFGFRTLLEDNLGIADIGSKTKGLKLFVRFKDAVSNGETDIPTWVTEIAEKLDGLPNEAQSILTCKCEPPAWDDENIPF